jgi:uncharacterized protein
VETWVQWAQRRAGTLLVVAALLAAAGGWGTARLYGDLRPDLTELLPRGARSAVDAARVTARVGGWAEETVALHGDDGALLRRFADALAPRLRAIPELVDSVEYRIDDIEAFLRARRWLFAPRAQLQQLAARLGERDLVGAAAVLAQLEAAARAGAEPFARFPDGYYAHAALDPEGRPTQALVLRVRLAGNPNQFERIAGLDRALRQEIARLRAERGPEPLAVDLGGYVASTKFEHDGLAEDLVVATVLVMLACGLAISLYFRTVKAVLAIGAPLAVGALMTFGITELTIGHLNSNTAFLGSIVLGNGVNAGLILFARYAEERRASASAEAAMTTALATTWRATLTAALGAGIAYASLAVTDFRGFKQFGLIGGVGMASCWLATYAFTPALVLFWERHGRLVGPGTRRTWLMAALARVVERAPGRVLALTALLGVIAAGFALRFARDPMEYDFGKLRDVRALHGGGPAFWEDAVFGSHHDPCVVLTKDVDEARRVHAAFAGAGRPTIGRVVSIASFVPDEQEAKLALLATIRQRVTPALLAALPERLRLEIEAELPPAELRPFSLAELPAPLRRRLSERDGTVGTPVLVYPTDAVSVWDGRDALRVERDLRAVPLPRADIPMASSLLVFADVLHAIRRDGPRATLVSLVGVALLVLLLLRNGKDALLVLSSLVLGVLFFAGVAGALGMKLTMLSFIALPITFGIGVDYATNLVQRQRVSGAGYPECLRSTGGAVALCSLTTIIGYSSLLVAHNQALRSFGLLADLGELACLAAALLVLPSLARRLA